MDWTAENRRTQHSWKMPTIHLTIDLTAFLLDYRAVWTVRGVWNQILEGFPEPEPWKVLTGEERWVVQIPLLHPRLVGSSLFHQLTGQSLNNVLERIRSLLEKTLPATLSIQQPSRPTWEQSDLVFLKSNVIFPEAPWRKMDLHVQTALQGFLLKSDELVRP